mgnify:CR=1 FL=1|jgi:membrane protein
MNNFLKVLCLAVYVAILTWLNLRRADPDLLDVLGGGDGSGLVILTVLLALMYGAIAICTLWVVGALSRFTYKLAIGRDKECSIPGDTFHWLIIVALLIRIPALLTQHFVHSDLGIAAYIIPVALGAVWLVRDSALVGARKLLALLPIFGYIAVDVMVLLSSKG